MAKQKFFDDLDEWFNGTNTKTKKSKGSAGGITSMRNRISPSASTRSANIQKAANSISGAKKIPQVMVKISGSSKGADKAQAHVNYIGRKGSVEIEDENGIVYKGKEEQKELLKSWEAMGMHPKDNDNKRREAFHIVFSMPKGTNPQALKAAVRNTVQEEFAGHKYYMAQHLDTDSPHCHVLLCATDDRGARLNPRKADLHNYRVAFVNKLAEQGIEATTSRSVHRFQKNKSKDQGVIHRDARNDSNKNRSKNKPTASQQRKIDSTHKDVLSQYKGFVKTLDSDSPAANSLNQMIKKQQRKLNKSKDNER